jgi:hypothetical protein
MGVEDHAALHCLADSLHRFSAHLRREQPQLMKDPDPTPFLTLGWSGATGKLFHSIVRAPRLELSINDLSTLWKVAE